MDKVIIDGIDVSGCPFYQYQTKEDYEMKYPESGDCEIGLAGYLFDYSRITEELEKACIDNPNCYYKQLKRLQAENEQLLSALQEIRDIAEKHDYWKGNLQSATNIIDKIQEKINEVIGVKE